MIALAAFLSIACGSTALAAAPFPVAKEKSTPRPLLIYVPSKHASPEPRDNAPLPTPQSTPQNSSPTPRPTEVAPFIYITQSGDTLPALAVRFGVKPEEIRSQTPLPKKGLLKPNTVLIIPRRVGKTTPNTRVMPDSEVVYSPSAIGFDVRAFIQQAGGYMSTYREYLTITGNTSGAQIIQMVSLNNSINPRLLIALLEYQSHSVFSYPQSETLRKYPIGFAEQSKHGLYRQVSWAVAQLSKGYYGWREGLLTTLTFRDGTKLRLAPDLNAGTVALAYFFAQMSPNLAAWQQAMNPKSGFPAFYKSLFGDPWERAYAVEPLYPPQLKQPKFILPFQKGVRWYFTGGPHGAWEHEGALAALDFAPGSIHGGCEPSRQWVLAVAPGVVARSGYGVVMLDLDGDGKEQTGWDVLYLHIASRDRVPVGTHLNTGDKIGHPSCEGGIATGTHVHIARKYNGEWIAADGPVPFVMDGWVPHNGRAPYKGTLTKGDKVIKACPCGSPAQMIVRDDSAP